MKQRGMMMKWSEYGGAVHYVLPSVPLTLSLVNMYAVFGDAY